MRCRPRRRLNGKQKVLKHQLKCSYDCFSEPLVFHFLTTVRVVCLIIYFIYSLHCMEAFKPPTFHTTHLMVLVPGSMLPSLPPPLPLFPFSPSSPRPFPLSLPPPLALPFSSGGGLVAGVGKIVRGGLSCPLTTIFATSCDLLLPLLLPLFSPSPFCRAGRR